MMKIRVLILFGVIMVLSLLVMGCNEVNTIF